MKKQLIWLLAPLLALGMCILACAEDEAGFTYAPDIVLEKHETEVTPMITVLADGTCRLDALTFEGAEPSVLRIPETVDGMTVSAIHNMLLCGFENVTEVILPASVKAVGMDDDLERDSLYLGPGVASLRQEGDAPVFRTSGCVVYLGSRAVGFLPGAMKTQVVIDEGATAVSMRALNGCRGVAEITIPAGVTEINLPMILQELPGTLKRIHVAQGNAAYHSTDGVLYSNSGEVLRCPPGFPDQSLWVEAGAKSVAPYAFVGCEWLETVILPGSVELVQGSAFVDCGDLQNLTLPLGVQVEARALINCPQVGRINLSPQEAKLRVEEDLLIDNATGTVIFALKSSFGSYRLPADVKAIGPSAFEGSMVRRVIGNAALEEIGDGAFRNAGMLGSVELPEDSALKRIGDGAFRGCTFFSGFRLPEGLESIGTQAFADCRTMDALRLPESVREIGRYAFSGCTALKELVLPLGMERFDLYAVDGCGSLALVVGGDTKLIGFSWGEEGTLVAREGSPAHQWHKQQMAVFAPKWQPWWQWLFYHGPLYVTQTSDPQLADILAQGGSLRLEFEQDELHVWLKMPSTSSMVMRRPCRLTEERVCLDQGNIDFVVRDDGSIELSTRAWTMTVEGGEQQ